MHFGREVRMIIRVKGKPQIAYLSTLKHLGKPTSMEKGCEMKWKIRPRLLEVMNVVSAVVIKA